MVKTVFDYAVNETATVRKRDPISFMNKFSDRHCFKALCQGTTLVGP
jgi:hypothetical protein